MRLDVELIPRGCHARVGSIPLQLNLNSASFTLLPNLKTRSCPKTAFDLFSLKSHRLSMSSLPAMGSRGIKSNLTRSRLLAIAGITVAALFVLHFVFPGSHPLLAHTQKWTTASSSVIRSKFLRAKAKAPKPPIHHPIPKLMADAKDSFEAKLSRQSRTLAQAVTEYKRRYKRDPPAGFDHWYQFAKDNGAIIFDEYDQLARDLEPFWLLSGEELRRRCVQVGYLPSVDLVRIENGQTKTLDVSKGFDDSEVGARAKGFRVMLEKFQHMLPDMDFPINEKAEGRILVPWEENLYSNLTADSTRESLLRDAVLC